MRHFSRIEAAASYALRCTKPAFVFDGPDGGYVVAIGRDARRLMNDGHEAISLSGMAKAA